MLFAHKSLGLSVRIPVHHVTRKLNTQAANAGSLRRSYLYVPSSSDRMLEKSLSTKSDVIIYDLEDSVPPSTKDKDAARKRLKDFLGVCP